MPAEQVITRRNLPHWYAPGAAHFVTFRLAGSLPQALLLRLREDRKQALAKLGEDVPATERQRMYKLWFGRYDAELDRGGDPTFLRQPPVAAIVRKSLHFLNGTKYHLIAYSIMPNHVHALFQPIESLEASRDSDGEEKPDTNSPLSVIMHSLKSYTAHRINELLGRTGAFWQSESYDHWVRDDDELERIVLYVAQNPVKAGLVRQPHEWYYCSAHDRFLEDGSEQAWLEIPS